MTDEEILFPITNFPGYSVSTHGNVYDPAGDLVPTFYDSRTKMICVRMKQWEWEYNGPVSHMMLRYIFIGNSKDVILGYVDGNPRNLHVDNLTISYQNQDGIEIPIGVTVLDSGTRALDRRHRNRVMIVETGDVYDNVADCARAIGGSATNIFAFFRGTTKSVKGYTFRRV